MRALYESAPAQAAEGDVIGAALVAAIRRDQENREVEIWPENWPAFRIFSRLSTQWRTDMSGPTGLCYEAVYPLIDRQNLPPDEWEQMFDDVQVMERAARSVMRGEPIPQPETPE